MNRACFLKTNGAAVMLNIVFTRQLADWSRLTNARTQTQHEETLTWGEVALFLKMNFREQVSSVVHHRRWNEAEEIVFRLDLAMSVCRRGVNITGVLLILPAGNHFIEDVWFTETITQHGVYLRGGLCCRIQRSLIGSSDALKWSYHIFLFGFIYLCFPLWSTWTIRQGL